MGRENQTLVTEFVILGFPSLEKFSSLLFVVFLTIYLFTVTGNILIFLLVRVDHHLHTPMFFLLNNLSLLEICYTTVIIPKMLSGFLSQAKNISFTSCMVQLYTFSALGAAECYLLTVMAYDRYLAICKPLHYVTMMSNVSCLKLAAGSWVSGFLSPLLPVILISRLPFCGPNEINYFYCDAQPLLKLSCMDTFVTEASISILASTLILSSFVLTVVSYIYIISTILRISSATGRQKAFSTCGSHLTVVIIFYGTIVCMYVQPTAGYSLDVSKVLSLLYTVFTPMLNPIIYSLRNKDIREALRKLIGRRNVFPMKISDHCMNLGWKRAEIKIICVH
ncbi:olfactory receptor 6N1-like [Rhinatrema bivittatum]|uniref:olfactory receptor 6N1-like n=1 Tax=Rhinatrema bivittatum TaxID=194408 RepID=UPI00112D76AE|nr:olfactory receptor 6N1-like [Rhinatrema bivittatum]